MTNRFELTKNPSGPATNGQAYFVLVAANHEPIGTSETYSSIAAMEHGIASVKQNAPSAPIDDKT